MSIYNKLLKWQQNVVDKFKNKQSLGLFLDMGTGKTPLSLAFAEVNNCTRLIVISLNSKVLESPSKNDSWYGWCSQSSIKYEMWQKSTQINNSDEDAKMICFNYESLFKHGKKSSYTTSISLNEQIIDFIKHSRNHNICIIVDESHKMKNIHSKQTKAIEQIKRECYLYAKDKKVYTYLLSGTPFTKGYEDLYAQLKYLGCKMTKSQFIEMFCERGNIPGLFGWQQPIVGYKNIEKLYDLVHQFAITMQSSDIVELPEKIFKYHNTSMSDSFKLFTSEKAIGNDIYKYIVSNHMSQIESDELCQYNVKHKINNPFYRNIDYPDRTYLCETAGTFWLRARQLSIGFIGNAEKATWYDERRVNKLYYFLKENENNYVIFYNYTPELFKIFDICEQLEYNIDVYCGEIKSQTFYEIYQKQDEAKRLTNKKNVIISNFASGSTGMNWQLYNQCIVFSLPLYKDWAQGLKRIHRIGQQNTVVYHIFIQQNWLDYSMSQALKTQTQYSQEMFEADSKRIEELMKGNENDS